VKSYNSKFNAIHPYAGRTIPNQETRQILRARLRREAFTEISSKYPGESRSSRRAMALSRGNRNYRLTHKETCPPHRSETTTS
jgi:hypothetical protein